MSVIATDRATQLAVSALAARRTGRRYPVDASRARLPAIFSRRRARGDRVSVRPIFVGTLTPVDQSVLGE